MSVLECDRCILTGHILKDCENLLKEAWKDIRVTKGKPLTEVKAALFAIYNEIKTRYVTYNNESAFDALQTLLNAKVTNPRCTITGFISCNDMFRALELLFRSNYERYDIIDTGNAMAYFKQAIPFYCRLAGLKEYKVNFDKKSKSTLQDMLVNGEIIDKLGTIEGVRLTMDKQHYVALVNGITTPDSGFRKTRYAVIAYKKNYEVQLVNTNITYSNGINIANTPLNIRVVNTKTLKELKITNFLDIKRILTR